MFRTLLNFVAGLTVVFLLGCATLAQAATSIKGSYLETRTCQVYTGPCFANSETGLTGRDAIMAWHIEKGKHQGTDLAGLNVVVVVNANETLGHQGLDNADELRSVIFVDERADSKQQEALVDFAKTHSGKAAQSVVRVYTRPIQMKLDLVDLKGQLSAGGDVKLSTRKARPGDCICSNETAFYPPLAKVENFAAGVTIEGEFRGRGLGTQWSTPESRSAYMATFAY